MHPTDSFCKGNIMKATRLISALALLAAAGGLLGTSGAYAGEPDNAWLMQSPIGQAGSPSPAVDGDSSPLNAAVEP
jgi:hypothetical protein